MTALIVLAACQSWPTQSVTTPKQAIHIAMNKCAADFRAFQEKQFRDESYWTAKMSGDHWIVNYLRTVGFYRPSGVSMEVTVARDGSTGDCFGSLFVP